MRDRVAEAARRLDEISELMSQPEVVTDGRRLQAIGREQAALAPLVEHGRELDDVERQITENQALLSDGDPQMRELAEEELRGLEARRDQLASELRELLVPRDPNDDRNVIIEIRPGTGGDEAALFAG